jgi:hypothetical protein
MIEVMCMDYHKVSYRKHKVNFLDIVKRERAQRVIKNTLNLNLSHDEKSAKTFFLLQRKYFFADGVEITLNVIAHLDHPRNDVSFAM